MTTDLTAEVRTTLRLDIAEARERAELVDALQGSVLWLRLKRGGLDDERRRLDALPWGYERTDKDYGPDPVLPV